MIVNNLVLIRHSVFSRYCRVGGVPGNMRLWALTQTTEAPFRCTQMGFLEICLVWSGTSNITSRFMLDKSSLPPLHGNRPLFIQKKKKVLNIRRKLYVNYPWLAIWTKFLVFTSVAVSERLYKHYLHCSPRVFQHTISSAAGAGKAFLSIWLSKTTWVLQPLHANWPLLLFLLRTWALFPWKYLCSKSMSLILLLVTLFLTTGLQCCPPCLQCSAGEEGLCRSWKLWRKYSTINLLPLFFSFEKTHTLTFFSSKENSLWNQESMGLKLRKVNLGKLTSK